MMWFPERPKNTEATSSGKCGTPECLPDCDFEGPDEDEFVRLLLECLAKPIKDLKGGCFG